MELIQQITNPWKINGILMLKIQFYSPQLQPFERWIHSNAAFALASCVCHKIRVFLIQFPTAQIKDPIIIKSSSSWLNSSSLLHSSTLLRSLNTLLSQSHLSVRSLSVSRQSGSTAGVRMQAHDFCKVKLQQLLSVDEHQFVAPFFSYTARQQCRSTTAICTCLTQ